MRVLTFLGAFVAFLIAAFAPVAHAADGDRPVFGMGTMATIGGLFGPPDKRGLVDPDLFFRYVELDEESAAVARQIILQVRDATERAIEEYQQSLQEMTGEVAMFEAALPVAKKQSEEITNAFAELELLVPEGQERAWEAFLMHQFRRGFFHMVMRGTASDGGVADLQDMAYEVGVWDPTAPPSPESEAATLILEQWARTIDAMARGIDTDFRALMEHLDEFQRMEDSEEGMTDPTFPARLTNISRDIMETGARTHEITTETREKLVRTLLAADRERFLNAYRERAFPSVYRPRRLETWVEETLAGGELTEVEQTTLQAAWNTAQNQLRDAREAMWESMVAFNEVRTSGPGASQAVGEAAKKRLAAARAFGDVLYALEERVLAVLGEERATELGLQRSQDPLRGRHRNH